MNISRKNSSANRFFPFINKNLYEIHNEFEIGDEKDQQAKKLLSLAHNYIKREAVSRLNPKHKVTLVFIYHKRAFIAELAKKSERADFFWEKTYQTLHQINNRRNLWKSALEGLDIQIENYHELFNRLIKELFIDTHCAFFNGYFQNKSSDIPKRALVHFDYLQKLLPLSDMPNIDKSYLLKQAIKSLIPHLERKNQWDDILGNCKKLLIDYPDNDFFQQELIVASFSKTIYQIDKASEGVLPKADKLQTGIHTLNEVKKMYPYKVVTYKYLGYLHYLLSIELANNGKLSEALLAVQKSLTYDPYLKAAQEDREKILEMMKELQIQVETLKAQLAGSYNTKLTDKGEQMMREAKQGFNKIDRFIGSSEEKSIKESYNKANERNLWINVGLPMPVDNWDGRAKILFESLSNILVKPPANKKAITEAWGDMAKNEKYLSELDKEHIYRFLEDQLFPADGHNSVKTKEVDQDDAPVLVTNTSNKVPDSIPFNYWLFSTRDAMVKFLAIASVILLVFSVRMSILNNNAKYNRDHAYEVLSKISGEGQNFPELAEQVAIFVNNPPVMGKEKDNRLSEVQVLFEQSFSQWFLESEAAKSSDYSYYKGIYNKLLSKTEEL